MPLWRFTEGKNARLYAYVDELEAWEGRMAARGLVRDGGVKAQHDAGE